MGVMAAVGGLTRDSPPDSILRCLGRGSGPSFVAPKGGIRPYLVAGVALAGLGPGERLQQPVSAVGCARSGHVGRAGPLVARPPPGLDGPLMSRIAPARMLRCPDRPTDDRPQRRLRILLRVTHRAANLVETER